LGNVALIVAQYRQAEQAWQLPSTSVLMSCCWVLTSDILFEFNLNIYLCNGSIKC
jgi:hypothetical protein